MSGLLPTRLSCSLFTAKTRRRKAAAKLKSLAELIEDSIPNFPKEEERQFYREVAKSYRTAARDVLRNSDHASQEFRLVSTNVP